jgi:hypothetical protein
MNSGNVSPVIPRSTTPIALYNERRRVERRHSASSIRTCNKFDTFTQGVGGRRATDHAADILSRRDRNKLRRGFIDDVQADVEDKLGWAGVHAIRGMSGLGAATATALSVGMIVLTAFVPVFPGLGAVVFVGAYLAFTAIGVAVQMIVRRGRTKRVQRDRILLVSLRNDLLRFYDPKISDHSDQRGQEKRQLEEIDRLIKDIDGGFLWGMRCALGGLLEPLNTFKEGWNLLFGGGDRRREERRQSPDRRSKSTPA